MVVVWNTSNVSKGGEVTILAKAHTDVDILTMKVAAFDDTRYPHFSHHNNSLDLYSAFHETQGRLTKT